jgi:hypothetical protein
MSILVLRDLVTLSLLVLALMLTFVALAATRPRNR